MGLLEDRVYPGEGEGRIFISIPILSVFGGSTRRQGLSWRGRGEGILY